MLVDKDLGRAKELQTGHGGWKPFMEKVRGEAYKICSEIKYNFYFANCTLTLNGNSTL